MNVSSLFNVSDLVLCAQFVFIFEPTDKNHKAYQKDYEKVDGQVPHNNRLGR